MFYVFCSENLDFKRRLKAILSIEPTDLELKSMWEKFNLKKIHVNDNIGDVSDIIEVYEDIQIRDAFCVCFKNLTVGELLTPNKFANEDALNAYFP